jgi:uncharacterized protein
LDDRAGIHHQAGRRALSIHRLAAPKLLAPAVREGHCLAHYSKPTTKIMKITFTLRSLAVSLLAAVASTSAAEPATPPELRGILVTSKEPRFALVASGGEHSGWAIVGQTFEGWKLVNYLPGTDAIVLGRDDRQMTVRLNDSAVVPLEARSDAKATVAQAEEVLNRMKFESMWDRVAAEQKKAMVGAIRQQSAADFAKIGLPPEEIDTLMDKMGDVLVGGLQADAMKQDFARIFTEVYTPDELRGMADFYDTTAGRAWAAKQPEVQQKLMQAMMPRVMAGMPAAQKVAADYLRQRAATAAPPKLKP